MNFSKFSDEQLVVETREKDGDFFRELIRRYEGKLSRYLRRLVNDGDEIDDVLQNVFIKTYRNLRGFDENKKFSSWIYRIAHNEAVNHIKKISREKKVALEDIEKILPDEKSDPTADIDRKKEREDLEKGLSELDVKYREPLVLYYFEERSYEEISDILRLPVSTVGTYIFRGKKKIKEILCRTKK